MMVRIGLCVALSIALLGYQTASHASDAVPAASDPATTTPGWRALLIAGDTDSPAFAQGADYFRVALGFRGMPSSHIKVVRSGPPLGTPTLSLNEFWQSFEFLQSPGTVGCLFFATSHGAKDHGLVIAFAEGRKTFGPETLDDELEAACGDKPTIVIISGCYTGIYADRMRSSPKRIIMTAARRDNPSFGCGTGNVYTYFDGCLLAAMMNNVTWREVSRQTGSCVEAKEQAGGFTPSMPQSRIGADLAKKRPLEMP